MCLVTVDIKKSSNFCKLEKVKKPKKAPSSPPIQTILSVVESHHISLRSRTSKVLFFSETSLAHLEILQYHLRLAASSRRKIVVFVTAGRESHPALKTSLSYQKSLVGARLSSSNLLLLRNSKIGCTPDLSISVSSDVHWRLLTSVCPLHSDESFPIQ